MSIVRACQNEPIADRPSIDLADAYEIWIANYERILNHLSRRGNWHFMHLDQAFCPTGLDALEAFTGHTVNRQVAIPELRTDATSESAPERARAIYAELCQLANYVPEEHAPSTGAASPEVALVVPVLDSHKPHLPRLLEELENQRGVRAQTILVDQTTEGGLVADNADVIREPNPSRGLAYKRALEITEAPFIAWQDPAVTLFPHRLARQLPVLRDHATAHLCTSELALHDGQGRIVRQVAVDLSPHAPPPFWESGVLVRRSALAEIETATFAPAELELFDRLFLGGRTVHLDEALGTVCQRAFENRGLWVQQDAELVRIAQLPRVDHPKVSVLMASHNRKEALMECLEALSRQLLPRGTFEVIVIDDGSRDGTQELFRDMQLPVALRFIEQENAGAASARNRGLPFVQSELVLFINDDTILFQNTVRGHLEAHRELDSQRAIVLGTFEQPAEECEKTLTRLLEASTLVFGYHAFEKGADVGGVNFYTCNLSLPTEAVRAAGLFDEEFPMFGEDTDYGLRLENMGYRIHYREELRATHRHILPFESIERRQVAVGTAQIRLYEKHPRVMPERHLERTVPIMEERRAMTMGFAENVKRTLRNLGSLRITSLEREGCGANESAKKIGAYYLAHFLKMNVLLWESGFTSELKRRGLTDFKELLQQAARPNVDSPAAPLPSDGIDRSPLGIPVGDSHGR